MINWYASSYLQWPHNVGTFIAIFPKIPQEMTDAGETLSLFSLTLKFMFLTLMPYKLQ